MLIVCPSNFGPIKVLEGINRVINSLLYIIVYLIGTSGDAELISPFVGRSICPALETEFLLPIYKEHNIYLEFQTQQLKK